jgi:4-hydroxy-tetrahydrodipicolinate synthase
MLNLRGSFVALVTPFDGGRVSRAKLRDLVEFHIEHGTDGIVPTGTTGESATLSHEEHGEVVEVVVEAVGGRIGVLAGTGSNSTAEAIALTQHAKSIGADGALLVTPYYNKPTQEGLYQHFLRIAEATDFPLVPYNVPSRTSVNLLPETVGRLAKLPQIVGIKEASGDISQITEVAMAARGQGVAIMSGNDDQTLPILAVGGAGVISVTANIAPGPCAEIVSLWEAGKRAEALAAHLALYRLHKAMFVETNPGPVKAACNLLGLGVGEPRLPLVAPSPQNMTKVRDAMQASGLELKLAA